MSPGKEMIKDSKEVIKSQSLKEEEEVISRGQEVIVEVS